MLALQWTPQRMDCRYVFLSGCLLISLFAKNVHSLEREQDGAYSPKERHLGKEEEYHHEVILGNEKLHEEFHHQTPEQSRIRLLELAASHDLDKDGVISAEELQEWIFKSFQDLNSEDAHNKFEDADTDGDGFVTWSEHLKDTWGLENDENLLKSEEYKDEFVMIQEEELLFDAADRDQDGKLSTEEYLAFERPEQFDFMQPLVIQRTKEARDKNGDGFVDFHEYIVEIVPNYKKITNQEEREVYITEKERFEEYFDLDRDGKLNDGEIFRWLIPNENETAKTETEHILEKADKNKDGRLSFDEISENSQVFVGSEITDYGNSLTENGEKHDEL